MFCAILPFKNTNLGHGHCQQCCVESTSSFMFVVYTANLRDYFEPDEEI